MKKKVIKEFIHTMFNTHLKKGNGLHFTVNHNGKMSGMYSLSTTCKDNAFCEQRIRAAVKYGIDDCICKYCFSDKQQNFMKTMKKPLIKNGEILRGDILSDDKIPVINAFYFRFEAFGDIANAIQVINYFKICYKNPRVNFALWTKNPWFIKEAIESGFEKPENLNIIYSSVFMNSVGDAIANYYTFIDKVFTVYNNEDEAKKQGVSINCGSRNCIECGLCYEKNNTRHINELLK